jgi:hypothetical protein
VREETGSSEQSIARVCPLELLAGRRSAGGAVHLRYLTMPIGNRLTDPDA